MVTGASRSNSGISSKGSSCGLFRVAILKEGRGWSVDVAVFVVVHGGIVSFSV